MESHKTLILFALFVASAAFAMTIALKSLSARARRRTMELGAAADALTAHFEAVERIIDDPALPTDALDMLVNFSEAIQDEDFCDGLTAIMLEAPELKGNLPQWALAVEKLSASRPDLVSNFNSAIASGLMAAFLRWPSTAPRIYQLAGLIAAGGRREAILADKVSYRPRKNHNNHNDHMSGGGLTVAAA